MLTLLDEHEEDADEESLPGRAAQHTDPAAAALVRGALGALELLDCAHDVRVGGAEALLSRDGLVAVARHDVVPAQRPHAHGQRAEGTSAHSREGRGGRGEAHMGVSTRTRAVRTRPATEEPTAIHASMRQSLSTPPRKYAPAAPILHPARRRRFRLARRRRENTGRRRT